MGLFSKPTKPEAIADSLFRAAPFLNPRVISYPDGKDAVVLDVYETTRALAVRDGNVWNCGIFITLGDGDEAESYEVVPPVMVGGRVSDPAIISHGILTIVANLYRSETSKVPEDVRDQAWQDFARQALRLISATGQ